MSDELENNINQRMQDFRVSPGPKIWERVAAALPPEKKRRRFAIWWWLPLVACLGGGSWLVMNKHQKNAVTVNENRMHTDLIKQNNNKQTAALTPADTVNYFIKQKPVIKQADSIKRISPKKSSVEFRKDETVTSSNKIKKQNVIKRAHPLLQKQTELMSSAAIVVLNRHHKKGYQATEDTAGLSISTVGKEQLLAKVTHTDSTILPLQYLPLLPDRDSTPATSIPATTDTNVTEKKDTLVVVHIDKKSAKEKSKINKATWSLSFGAGSSNLKGGFRNDEKSLPASYNSPLSGAQGVPGATGNTGSFISPQAGISFSAGMVRQQAIGKHWGWQASLTYQLLTAKQRTGARNDSILSNGLLLLSLADAYLVRTTSSAAVNTYTNQVHRLQIGSGVYYILNPAARSPIRFFAGASFAYHFSNSILLHDYRYGFYVRSASLTNKLMLGSAAGFDVFICKKINAGLSFQHDFTNVGKNKIGSSFHWNEVQVNVGIPLSKHK